MKKLSAIIITASLFLAATPAAQAACLAGAECIGSEALTEPLNSASYSGIVNFAPGDGETVSLNPPRFRWTYRPQFNDIYCWNGVCPTYAPKKFKFQIADNPQFNNPIERITLSNSYNFLAPFTAGKTYYWKVGYINPKNLQDPNTWTLKDGSWEDGDLPYVWSETRTFTIASDATAWDRSMLADADYLKKKLGQHPHMLFNSTTRVQLYKYLSEKEQNYLKGTGSPDDRQVGQTWQRTKADASAAIASSWWPNTKPSVDVAIWSNNIGKALFVYQLGKSAPEGSADRALSDTILVSHPGQALAALANDYINQGALGVGRDVISNHSLTYQLNVLSYGYDWLYDYDAAGSLIDHMSPSDRAAVLRALELRLKNVLYGQQVFWFSDLTYPARSFYDPSGKYDGGHFISSLSSLFMGGSSHGIGNLYASVPALLSCYADSEICRFAFDLIINYYIGVTYPFSFEGAPNAGRGYTLIHFFVDAGPGLYSYMMASIALPEANLDLNPFWKQNALYWDRFIPVGLLGPSDQWEDYGMGDFGHTLLQFGPWLAGYTKDSVLATHWRNEAARYYNPYGHILYGTTYDFLPFRYFYPIPADTANTATLNAFFPFDGYAMGCSYAASNANCFKNGVGYVFEAKPRAIGNGGHAAFSDLSFDIWAYGTTITAGNGSSEGTQTDVSWLYHPMQRNSLLINGLGELTQLMPKFPYYNRIFAYKSAPDYTYIAADGTNGYPIAPNINADNGAHYVYNEIKNDYQYYANAPLSFLQKVRRHFLFVRNKYFVIFDDLASNQSGGSTFSWLYHILEPGINLNEEEHSFSYTSNIKRFLLNFASPPPVGIGNSWRATWIVNGWADKTVGPDVNVFVKHIEDPSKVIINDRTGDDRQRNPFTGEDYNADMKYNTASYLPQGQDLRADALWFNTLNRQNNFHFMTVIYPKNPADPDDAAHTPEITRIDDYTAKVRYGSDEDIIRFNPGTGVVLNAEAQPTIEIDLAQLTPLPVPDAGYSRQSAYKLSVITSGNGAVTGSGINCGANCEVIFSEPATVSLTAAPSAGSLFSGWGGACSGSTGSSCTVNVASERYVTASFLTSAGNNTIPGDISGNGSVTAYDAALALQLGKTTLEAAGIAERAVGLQ